jgi:hypothetical protein
MFQPPPVHPDADGRDRRDLRSVPLLLAIPLEGNQVLAYASQSSLSAFRVGDGCVTHTKLNERDPVRMSGTTADHEIGLVCGELVPIEVSCPSGVRRERAPVRLILEDRAGDQDLGNTRCVRRDIDGSGHLEWTIGLGRVEVER